VSRIETNTPWHTNAHFGCYNPIGLTVTVPSRNLSNDPSIATTFLESGSLHQPDPSWDTDIGTTRLEIKTLLSRSLLRRSSVAQTPEQSNTSWDSELDELLWDPLVGVESSVTTFLRNGLVNVPRTDGLLELSPSGVQFKMCACN
jgi:hypothetical protein